jgi:hypothetical protein
MNLKVIINLYQSKFWLHEIISLNKKKITNEQ